MRIFCLSVSPDPELDDALAAVIWTFPFAAPFAFALTFNCANRVDDEVDFDR
jgi:hypothetical protein